MAQSDLLHLELLAEIDALVERLDHWARPSADTSPGDWPLTDWQPAETCRAIVRRLAARVASLRVRLDAPLVVAMLGGSGTGKSALVNALAGEEVVATGRQRPTTLRPTLLCRPGLTPQMLGIDAAAVEVIERDLSSLANLVLIDCPDPDTSESDTSETDTSDPAASEVRDRSHHATNLARLRQILPYCDVLLVTTTQQKYRSARVADELALAAPGAKPVFVQTHADVDADIRDDWSRLLGEHYTPGHIFHVDSPAVLADAATGRLARGEFAALVDLLTRQFAGAAAARIRRANFLDLAAQALDGCRRRLDEAMPRVTQVQTAIEQQREQLAAKLATEMRAELLVSRRQWENRLLGQVTSQWGFSPFSLLLRIYQGFGGLVSGALLYRARTPAQLALWGAVEGARAWQSHRSGARARRPSERLAAGGWNATDLRASAIILEGHTIDAGFNRDLVSPETVQVEADRAVLDFAAKWSRELDRLVSTQAARHTGWFTRGRYELLLVAMMGVLLYRLAKNFFYDSWWAPTPVEVWGLQSYVAAAFWLVLWSFLLLWLFTRRLRRGLRQSIGKLAEGWPGAAAASGIFGRLENQCGAARRFRQDLEGLVAEVDRLRQELIRSH